jgi:DNA invertase Pin-like site-specific DNA recombinase
MSSPLPVEAPRPRAVAYIRVSKERDDMISPELQERAIRDHCDRRGYELTEILTDLDMSGRFWKRRQIDRAIGMIEAGQVERVVVWKISRVSRDPRRLDWHIAVARVEAAGGKLESATEPIDTTTSTGRFSANMLAELAAFESERAGEGWKETHSRRISKGLPASGRARFGYVKTGGAFVPDPELAPIIRGMYERYVGGDSIMAVFKWLQPFNLGTMRTHAAVRAYMDSGFAAGWITHHDPACTRPHRADERGKRCPNQVRTRGAHEPIVDEALWQRYLDARKARAGEAPRVIGARYAFTGLVFCEACGWRMSHATEKASRASQHGVYRCMNYQHCPSRVTVSEARIERAVLDFLPTVAADVDAKAATTKGVESTQRAEHDRLQRVAIDAAAALTQLTKDFARRLIPEDVYVETRDELIGERVAAEHAATLLTDTRAKAAARRRFALDTLATWPHATEPERNALLREIAVVHVLRLDGAPPRVLVHEKWDAPALARRPGVLRRL